MNADQVSILKLANGYVVKPDHIDIEIRRQGTRKEHFVFKTLDEAVDYIAVYFGVARDAIPTELPNEHPKENLQALP